MALRSVSTLLDTVGAAVWRADALACAPTAVLASGHAALDAQLPGGGWPRGALCEILQTQPGQHEWRLLLPALRQLVTPANGAPRCVLLVGAPAARFTPLAPSLAAQGLPTRALLWVRADSLEDRLWVAEQALRCAGVAALLLWLHDAPTRRTPRIRAEHLRRLQLGAQAQAKLLFVMRAASAQHEASPAALRLLLGSPTPAAVSPAPSPATASQDDLCVRILKRRGPPLTPTLRLPARHAALAALPAPSATLWPAQTLMPEIDHALDRIAAAA